jgi:hypothetical protein
VGQSESCQPPRKLHWRSRTVVDASLVVVIVLLGGWWGARFERAWHASGRQAFFYQEYFEPAVMMACGHGFVRAESRSQVEGLDDFLATRRDDMPCERIPPGVKLTREGIPVRAWYHFMITVAAVWRIWGVSWSGLNPLFGLLFGTVLVLVYGLFRLGLGPGLSALGTFLVAVSPVHLVNLPHLRDYAKAPFALGALLIAGWMVTRPFRARRVLILATLAGSVVGVGYGFRTDLLAAMPPLLLTVLFFLPGGLRRNVLTKLGAAALLLLAFLGASGPAFSYRIREGSCQGHVILLGLMRPFDYWLGIEVGSYDWGDHVVDSFAYSAVTAHATRGADGQQAPPYCSPEYDRETLAYLLTIARLFPADMATRALASLDGVANVAFAADPPLSQYDGALYHARRVLVGPLKGLGIFFLAAASLAAVLGSLRLGLWALCVLLYHGIYPMLQFDPRHHFHLEWLGWYSLGFSCLMLSKAFRAGFRRFRAWRAGDQRTLLIGARELRAPAARGLLWVGLVASMAGGLVAFRSYQRVAVPRLLRAMIASSAQPIALVEQAADAGPLLKPAQGSLQPPERRGPSWGELLRLDVRPQECSVLSVRYESQPSTLDYSRTFYVPRTARQATLLIPVFRHFVGFEIEGGSVSCVSGAYRAADRSRIPVWVYAVVPADVADLRSHQRLRNW